MSAPTFVLVPGGGGSAWCWSRLTPRLEGAGARAVAVDLPGPDPEVGLPGYVDRVVEAVRGARSGGGPLVLVGLSFGGFSSSAAALVEPADHLVLLNAMIPLPGESAGQWWKAVGQAAARRENEAAAGRDPARPFDPVEAFLHDAPDDVLAEAPTHDRDEAEVAFASPWPGTAWPDVQTTVLVSDDDRLFPPGLQRRVARERLGLEAVMVPGGHLNALTRPAEVADALLAVVGEGPTRRG